LLRHSRPQALLVSVAAMGRALRLCRRHNGPEAGGSDTIKAHTIKLTFRPSVSKADRSSLQNSLFRSFRVRVPVLEPQTGQRLFFFSLSEPLEHFSKTRDKTLHHAHKSSWQHNRPCPSPLSQEKRFGLLFHAESRVLERIPGTCFGCPNTALFCPQE